MLPTSSDPSPPESRRSHANDPRPSMPGDVVGERYVLEFVLGRGAMGEVWAATHRVLGLPCAIKFLAVDPRFDTLDFDERFEVEAKTTARLSTKTRHIVRVSDYGHYRGKPFLVMERLEGETLEERIDRDGPLDVRPTIRIAEQIANALRVAHAEKLVHRDLKSANVFLAADEQGAPLVKVLDFGLVRVLEGSEPSVRTSIGLIVGSPHSMSPEQAAGKPIDARSDVWALATVLYEMLTGVSAFEGTQVLELVANVVRCDFVPIGSRDPKLEPFDPVFARAFSPKIDDRFATVDELVVAFRQAAGRTSSPCHEIPVTTAPEIVIDVEEVAAARAKLEADAAAESAPSSEGPVATTAAPSSVVPASELTPSRGVRAVDTGSDALELALVAERSSYVPPRKRRFFPAFVVLGGAMVVGVLAARQAGVIDRAYAETRGLVQPLTVAPLATSPAPLVTQAKETAPLVTNVPAPTPLVVAPPAQTTPLVATMPATSPAQDAGAARTTAAASPRGPVKVAPPPPRAPSPPSTPIAPKVVASQAVPVPAGAAEVPSASPSPAPTPTEVPPQTTPPAPSAQPAAPVLPALPTPSPGAPNPSDPASLM